MNHWSRLWAVVVAVAALGSVSTSCATVSVDSITELRSTGAGRFEIVLEFASVLNLPEQARVALDGTKVGVVRKIELADDHVDVTARIDSGVVIPANTRASLQQPTVLGDIFIQLERNTKSPAPALGPNGRIRINMTESPPQLEDTLASLSNFIGSGSIQRVQNSMLQINNVTPSEKGNLERIATRVAADLNDVGKNIETADLWLDGFAKSVDVLHRRIPMFQEWFSPDGQTTFDRATFIFTYLSDLVPRVGSVYAAGYWFVPLFESLGGALEAIKHSKWGVEDEIPKWRRWYTDSFLPQDKYPAINITSIVGPDGRELSGNVHDVLRLLGALP